MLVIGLKLKGDISKPCDAQNYSLEKQILWQDPRTYGMVTINS